MTLQDRVKLVRCIGDHRPYCGRSPSVTEWTIHSVSDEVGSPRVFTDATRLPHDVGSLQLTAIQREPGLEDIAASHG
jgi:hypothetical protein